MGQPMKHLMEPMMIGKVKIKNRFAMAAMAIVSYITPEGEYTKNGCSITTGHRFARYPVILSLMLPCRSF